MHEISATDGTIINSLKYSSTSSLYSWYGSILYDYPDAYVLMADVYVLSTDTSSFTRRRFFKVDMPTGNIYW